MVVQFYGSFCVYSLSYRHLALPKPEDVGPLKALISMTALVHPDHPLRKPGIDGLELYLGTSEDATRVFFAHQDSITSRDLPERRGETTLLVGPDPVHTVLAACYGTHQGAYSDPWWGLSHSAQ